MNGVGEILQASSRVIQRGSESLGRLPFANSLLGFSIFLAAYYVGYRYGMSFSQAAASPFWFPDSVLLCALLVSRPRRWWILVLATLPIRLFAEVAAGIPVWFSPGSEKGSATRIVNTLEKRIERYRHYNRQVGEWEFRVAFYTEGVAEVESLSHRILAERLDKLAPFGEIFCCSVSEATEAVETALSQLGLLHSARKATHL